MKFTAGIITATIVATCLFGSVGASADELNSSGDAANLLIPASGEVTQLPTGSQVVNGAETVQVDSQNEITVELSNAEHSVSFASSQTGDLVSEAAQPGLVFAGSSGTQTLVNSFQGGVQIVSVLGSESTQVEYELDSLSGQSFVLLSDGQAEVLDVNGEVLLTSLSPWAYDGAGRELSTHFEVDGTTLKQVVETSTDTIFPIVADPTWMWYAAAYGAQFSKAETRALASVSSVPGFCVLLPAPLSVVCGVAGAQWFLQAGLAANAGGCVFIAAVPAPLAVRYLGSGCR